MPHQPRGTTQRVVALLRTAHAGPALVVTAVATGLALAAELTTAQSVVLVAAVFTGQLSIGWSNDLIDLSRDTQSGRTDKPLATGEVDSHLVRVACTAAAVATVVLSLACGWMAGLVNLACVAAGWAYNLGLKSTAWSWFPYAAAFGGLPVFVSLAQVTPELPPWWAPLAGALLGVGAHLVNVLPDLAEDEATGVRGLPHRVGARAAAPLATALLVLASVVVTVIGPDNHGPLTWATLAVVLALALVSLTGKGRTPFRAALAIALVDVLALTWVL